jgi:DNA-binding transcriptional regulator YhcF (GntR family)
MPRKILPPLDWQIGEDEPKAEGLKKKFFSFIGKGMLPEGTRLPSVRQMAASSGVSKNTVERVYAELKDEGVIAVRPGSGFWVAERPPVICPPEIGAIAAEDSHVKMPILRPQRKRLTLFPFSGVTPVGLFPAAVP